MSQLSKTLILWANLRVLCDSQSRAPFENPNGIPSQSPGLRGTSYPGSPSDKHPQPQRGCGQFVSIRARDVCHNAVYVFTVFLGSWGTGGCQRELLGQIGDERLSALRTRRGQGT